MLSLNVDTRNKDKKNDINLVADIPRHDLLLDKLKTEKDPQTIFVSEWHPNFKSLPTILKKNPSHISK